MTGKEIYDLALLLIGCKNSDGSDNADCDDFLSRSCGIINILLAENLRLDRALKGQPDAAAESISSLSVPVGCHPLLARAVLPYALASLLVADEDAELSRKLQESCLLNKSQLLASVKGLRHEIEDCYPA